MHGEQGHSCEGGHCGPSGESMSGEKMCQMCGTGMGKGHAWRCCSHLCAKLAFALGVLALLGAWWATWKDTMVLGFDEQHLFHDASALLILSVALRKWRWKRHGGKCC
ncbi:MAG: hypothetical protein AAB562_03530 [Patescibacteria group bacterium]